MDGRSETKLSHILKHQNILHAILEFFPLAWLKLRLCSKLYQWRLSEEKFDEYIETLNGKLNLHKTEPHDIAAAGCVDLLWLLIYQGFSVKVRDNEGATLLQKAVHSESVPTVMLLLSKGASVNAKGAYGYTPLHECSYLGLTDICIALLNHKANVDALSKNGSTPLLVAAREGHVRICDALLRYGSGVDDGGDKGWTPLFIASGEGHTDVVRLLLNYHANPLEATLDLRLPINEADDNGHVEVVALLTRATQQAELRASSIRSVPQNTLLHGHDVVLTESQVEPIFRDPRLPEVPAQAFLEDMRLGIAGSRNDNACGEPMAMPVTP
eukprot:GEMP01018180.1.p1 GENE.GEMP01018180.1~~GEMP01018180.1.p1  ORF type:complete len:327 (+),score=62.58 GEMP01018180.1:118-1098(+)